MATLCERDHREHVGHGAQVNIAFQPGQLAQRLSTGGDLLSVLFVRLCPSNLASAGATDVLLHRVPDETVLDWQRVLKDQVVADVLELRLSVLESVVIFP